MSGIRYSRTINRIEANIIGRFISFNKDVETSWLFRCVKIKNGQGI